MKNPIQSKTINFGALVFLFPIVDLIISKFSDHPSVVNNPLLSLVFSIIGALIIYFRSITSEPTKPIIKRKLFKRSVKK